MKYSTRPFELLLTRFIARQTKKIEALINAFVNDATTQTMRFNPSADEDFYFRNYPALSKTVDKLLRDLSVKMTDTIKSGCEWSWDLANVKNDNMLKKVLGSIGESLVPLGAVERWGQKNLPALEAFEKRRIGGMGLSDKVWAYTKGIKGDLELALDLGIGEGVSADKMSRSVRQYLQNPDRLFRRVRDEKGVLHLSKSAANYHPGQGVYRSAYKNAVRLTATETNMAYRTADNERMNQLEFILGYEVHLSDNHTCLDSQGVPRPFYDICDELQGKYPKSFVFTGWHPNCYDDKSEVYTSAGWKLFKDVSADDKILTINPHSFDLEYSGYTCKIKSLYNGPMEHFYNRSYDQLVTPDHEVLCLKKDSLIPIFKRVRAKRCGKTQPIYRSSEWVGRHIDSVKVGNITVPFSLYAEFMGYWLSDGSLGHKWEIGIAQQDEHREAIYNCITNLGMSPRYNGGKVEFNSEDWYIYLQQFGTCASKYIPNAIKEAEPWQIKIFLDAFISCDGHIRKSRAFVGNRGKVCEPKEDERIYFTSSKRMADDLGELILKIGRRPSFRIGSKAGTETKFKNGVYTSNYDSWVITECRSKTATQYYKEEIPYNGWVYDLVLEKNATMYIRRNGKCFWGSNCRCYITTILPDEDEFINYVAAMDENGVSSYKLEGEITDIPPQMKNWLIDNEERIMRAKSLPYFIKDNPEIAPTDEIADKIDYEQLKGDLQSQERSGIAKDISIYEREAAHARRLAEKAGPDVQEIAETIATDNGGFCTDINYKSEASMVRKALVEGINPAYLKDTVRTTIIVDADHIENALAKLKEQPEFLRLKVQKPDNFLGYSGNIVNISAKGGVVAEIQVNTAKMIYAKERPEDAKRILGDALWKKIAKEVGIEGGLGHYYYEKARVLERGSKEYLYWEKLSKEYYRHFR